MMGKRARRRSPRSERYNLGCVWSLIRIFDFRRGRKLISDRKHGSSKHDVSGHARSKLNNVEEIPDHVDGTEETEFGRGYSGKPSVKALMEEEMASTQSLKKIPRDEVERILSDLGHEIVLEKNEKQSRKKNKAISDLHVNDLKRRGSVGSNVTKCVDHGSDFSFELAPNQVEIYKDQSDYQNVDFENNIEAYLALNSKLDRKHSDVIKDSYLQKALDNLADLVISHKIIDQKHLNGSKADQTAALDTLEILSSNKELYLRLLQDPNLNAFEHLQGLHSIQGDSIGSEEDIGSKQFPRESSIKGLASKASAGTEGASKASAVDKYSKPKNCQLNIKSGIALSNGGSLFYEEAKKHLVEMIGNQNQYNSLPIRRISKSLATLLYLADCGLLSPRRNNGKEEPHLSPKDTRLSTKQEDDVQMLDASRQEVENIACEVCIATDEQVIEAKGELAFTPSQEENYSEKETKAEGGRAIVDVEDINVCSNSDVSSESVVSEHDISTESFGEGGSEQSQLEKPELVDPSASNFPNSPERITEKPEISSSSTIPEIFNSSEPIFPLSFKKNNDTPEEISEERTTQTTHLLTDLPIQQSEIPFKEHHISLVPLRTLEDEKARFEYIATVVEASGLSTGESLESWYMDNQLLDPYLFDEVGALYNFNDESLLLFDCIGEVILEMREKIFQLTPSVSFVEHKDPASRGVNIIFEVSKCVEWYFQNQSPVTLDQIVRKDMAGKSWIDHQPESESIINESQDAILDDLLEEIVFDLWL
uniref:DUF4378 domain-containing protein n=1 Tax=Ananas comosus var. bracteatus TaxID=296719 RepID=A0A6V7QPW2_ANACO|nr:unnamed protein product [Ananas comosus var. bracteatus]